MSSTQWGSLWIIIIIIFQEQKQILKTLFSRLLKNRYEPVVFAMFSFYLIIFGANEKLQNWINAIKHISFSLIDRNNEMISSHKSHKWNTKNTRYEWKKNIFKKSPSYYKLRMDIEALCRWLRIIYIQLQLLSNAIDINISESFYVKQTKCEIIPIENDLSNQNLNKTPIEKFKSFWWWTAHL